MKLKELLNTNLDGWQLAQGYLLELKLDIMGFCPLVVGEYEPKKDRKIVIARSPDELHTVWKTMRPRQVRLNTIWILVNHEQKICIPISRLDEQSSMEESSEGYYLLDSTPSSEIIFNYNDIGVWSLRDESGAQFPWPKVA